MKTRKEFINFLVLFFGSWLLLAFLYNLCLYALILSFEVSPIISFIVCNVLGGFILSLLWGIFLLKIELFQFKKQYIIKVKSYYYRYFPPNSFVLVSLILMPSVYTLYRLLSTLLYFILNNPLNTLGESIILDDVGFNEPIILEESINTGLALTYFLPVFALGTFTSFAVNLYIREKKTSYDWGVFTVKFYWCAFTIFLGESWPEITWVCTSVVVVSLLFITYNKRQENPDNIFQSFIKYISYLCNHPGWLSITDFWDNDFKIKSKEDIWDYPILFVITMYGGSITKYQPCLILIYLFVFFTGWWWVLVIYFGVIIILTLLAGYPPFTTYFKNKYGKDCIKKLQWNGPDIVFKISIKTVAPIVVIGAFSATYVAIRDLHQAETASARDLSEIQEAIKKSRKERDERIIMGQEPGPYIKDLTPEQIIAIQDPTRHSALLHGVKCLRVFKYGSDGSSGTPLDPTLDPKSYNPATGRRKVLI